MMAVEAGALPGLARLFEAAGGGVAFGHVGAGLGRAQAAAGEVERVPAQADGVRRREREDQGEPDRHDGRPRFEARDHGKAFRSSSKCGPSRSLGQSPPQTIAVPWRAAAALKAAAMRG